MNPTSQWEDSWSVTKHGWKIPGTKFTFVLPWTIKPHIYCHLQNDNIWSTDIDPANRFLFCCRRSSPNLQPLRNLSIRQGLFGFVNRIFQNPVRYHHFPCLRFLLFEQIQMLVGGINNRIYSHINIPISWLAVPFCWWQKWPFSTTPNLGSKNLYFLFMLTIVTPLKRIVFQVGNLESFGVKFINKNLLGLPESVPAFVQRHWNSRHPELDMGSMGNQEIYRIYPGWRCVKMGNNLEKGSV